MNILLLIILMILVIFFLGIVTLFVVGVCYYFYLQSYKFGKNPSGKDLLRVMKSPNYKNGHFRNRHFKPRYTPGHPIFLVHLKFLFQKSYLQKPLGMIPYQVTELDKLPDNENWLVWFGHSAFLLHLDGNKYLVDPSLCPYVSPFPWAGKAFKGADYYQAEMMPNFDYLLISHDHPDMLSYHAIEKLRGKFKKVITGLGVGSHFRHWGFSDEQIIELDWGDKVELENGHVIYGESSHHGSRRNHQLNKTLWLSLVIITPQHKVYYSGDGGYDDSFQLAQQMHGDFDLAIMECGQYDPAWESIHIHPHQVVKAVKELGAKHLIPVHHSKFDIAHHRWDDPLIQMSKLAEGENYRLSTPKIGEVVWLDKEQQFDKWWEGVN